MFRTNSIIKALLFLPIVVILTWVFVHLFAVFGYFLAIGFVIIWLLFPKGTICFICRVKSAGEYCPFCKKTISDKDNRIPKTLRSVFLNAGLILVVSFLSLTLVFVEVEGINLIERNSLGKTVSFLIPPRGQFKINEIFPMRIEVSGASKPINAVQSDVSFDPTALEVVDIETKGSFANIFIQKEINNAMGYARISGGLPNPGFSGEKGIFATVLFRAKKSGVVEIEFLPSSLVLANDKNGTNVLKDFAKASYLILPESIKSQTEKSGSDEVTMKRNENVLGEDIDDTQLTFYEEEKVLGVKTEQDFAAKKKDNFFEKTISFLKKIDEIILYPFKLFLSLFQGNS